MARCPACNRRIDLYQLVTQITRPSYTCARCGREWAFTTWTLALAIVLALAPLVAVFAQYSGQSHLSLSSEFLILLMLALAAGLAILPGALIVFGRLAPSTRKK